MQFNVMTGKCLDIADFTYKGINLNFLSKPGLSGRNHYDTHGQEALRSIMGGMFFTCGLENICAPCVDHGKEFPMHGRIRSTPGEHVSADARWEDERYLISIQGEMREAELFGENMVLRRRIETKYGSKRIKVTDEVSNESFREEPLMLMYHFNVGYPLLSPECQVVIPSKEVSPRDNVSSAQINRWNQIDPPKDNEPEYVFIHELVSDENGWSFAAIWNPEIEIGLKISFDRKYLPYFYQWKTSASGDYALGLEPANSSVYGRLYHSEKFGLHKLLPMTAEKVELVIDVFDSEAEFAEIQQEKNKLLKQETKQ